jgi:N-acetylglutamate synthase-like GNAT family acetyltransferase
MDADSYEIKELSLNDLNRGLLDHFNRHQEIKRFWILENKEWILRDRQYVENLDRDSKLKQDLYFVEDWDEKKKREIVGIKFYNSIKRGGSIFGVFNKNNNLIAFANISGELSGSKKQYIKLAQLHVSYEHRNKGIGKELFRMCVKRAGALGAEKLYISTNFSEETQIFYKKMGCIDAEEIDQEMVKKEPYDRQLEYTPVPQG